LADEYAAAESCSVAATYTPRVSRADRRKLEVRERILGAAFDLFLRQGVKSTTIEDICERADIANRTFFNHFATRQDMLRALAEGRLANPFDMVVELTAQPVRNRLISAFDGIAAALVRSGDTYRDMIGEMAATVGYAVQRSTGLHDDVLELIDDGITSGEVGTRHDAGTMTDIVVAALAGGIVNWAVDRTYALETNLHDLGAALADLLAAGTSETERR
jgi:AcrR family transcriptional regulator